MPTAPRFHVTQDAAFVYVHVHVPYVRVSEMEFNVEGVHFSFYCKPYLLKLQFPHEVEDNELAKGVYDPNKENGTIVIHLPKKEPGLEFPDLDLLTKLLQPKKTPIVDLKAKSTPAPLIEVLQSTSTSDAGAEATTAATSAEAHAAATGGDATLLELEKRFVEVTKAEEASYTVKVTELKPRYGFNNAYSDVFRGWHSETSEILSLPNPDETPAEQRRTLREKAEDLHFDVERYLLDFANAHEDEYLDLAVKHVPHWRKYPVIGAQQAPVVAKKSLIMEVVTHQVDSLTLAAAQKAEMLSSSTTDSAAGTELSVLTDADRELLARLPNKEFLITPGSNDEQLLFGGLVDILLGYVYEHVTTQGDSGIESTWTISILSPTLSWLDMSAGIPSVIRSGVRRMLTFPLLRQFDLAIYVARQVVELLRRGKRVVLHSLLDLYRIVEKSETQYLLNSIYIQDYCIWIQSVSDERLLRLANEVSEAVTRFRKADSGWALEEMERQLAEQSNGEQSSGSESESDDDESDESSEEGDDDDDDDDGDDEQRVGEEVETQETALEQISVTLP